MPIDGNAASRTGKTRDISTRGVYFTIDNNLRTSTDVDLAVTLPVEVTGSTEVFIRVIGKVVRVDKRKANGNQPTGVVATITRYETVRTTTLNPRKFTLGFLPRGGRHCSRQSDPAKSVLRT